MLERVAITVHPKRQRSLNVHGQYPHKKSRKNQPTAAEHIPEKLDRTFFEVVATALNGPEKSNITMEHVITIIPIHNVLRMEAMATKFDLTSVTPMPIASTKSKAPIWVFVAFSRRDKLSYDFVTVFVPFGSLFENDSLVSVSPS